MARLLCISYEDTTFVATFQEAEVYNFVRWGLAPATPRRNRESAATTANSASAILRLRRASASARADRPSRIGYQRPERQ